MFNSRVLFQERLKAHMSLMNRYLRYIFNGHFMIALMFIIVTLAVYYQRWLEGVSLTFPAPTIIAIAFSFVVLYNPIQSFLKEPDKVFIAVKEEAMGRYFVAAFIYNYVLQLYIVAIVLAAIGPLYFTFFPDRHWLINLLIVASILLIKGWNLLLNWRFLQLDDRTFATVEKIVRMAFTFALYYSLITLTYFPVIGALYIIYLNAIYIYGRKSRRINWERLIHNDAERLASFYRFVSLFAQVPQMKSRLRKRRILAKLVNDRTPFEKKATFLYLYRLTFLRSGEYFALFIRLTVLALLAIIFVTNVWVKLALAILFMYMTSFQLQTLFHHYRTHALLRLYPLESKEQEGAFLTLAMQISQVQAILLSLSFLLLGEWLLFVIMLLAGTIFNVGFHQLYIKKKIQTETYA